MTKRGVLSGLTSAAWLTVWGGVLAGSNPAEPVLQYTIYMVMVCPVALLLSGGWMHGWFDQPANQK